MRRGFWTLALVYLVISWMYLIVGLPVVAAPLNIVVADTAKVMEESIWGKKAIEEVEKETVMWQRRIDAISKQSESQELLQQDNIAIAETIRSLLQKGNVAIAETRRKFLEPISIEILRLVKELSLEMGYDLVLEKYSNVLYVDPMLDITSIVIVMLDKSYREKVAESVKEAASTQAVESVEEVAE